jgi:G3E family GTPase
MIPLTVIGGFLGAGKTTLVNHLLRVADKRFGVLVNDFGAINIDAALIASRDGGTIALTNGCVCCEIGSDLGAGLTALAARVPAIEHAIVEASGVSDPWRIAQLALVEPGFSLEPILVVADAEALPGQVADRWIADTVIGQIQAADRIILNKAETGTDAAHAILRDLRPGVPVTETTMGAIDPDLPLFDAPPFDAPPFDTPSGRFRADSPVTHDFPRLLFVPPGPFDRARLRAVLAGLPRSVLRIKGFCALGPEAAPMLLQYAAGQWALTPAPGSAPGLVVIGTPDMPAPEAMVTLLTSALQTTFRSRND